MAQPRPVPVRNRVCGMTSAMIRRTGRSLHTSTPRSPRTALAKNFQSWTGMGRSKPIRIRKLETISGVARGPSAMVAGSPGIK